MAKSSKFNLGFVLLTFLSCTHREAPPDPTLILAKKPLKITKSPQVDIQESAAEKKKTVDQLVSDYPSIADELSDIRAILAAQIKSDAADYEEALPLWEDAIKISSNHFADYSLQQLIRSEREVLIKGGKSTSEITAFIIAEELLKRELTKSNLVRLHPDLLNVEDFSLWIEKNFPELRGEKIRLSNEQTETESETEGQQTEIARKQIPRKDGIPVNDPFLLKTVDAYCRQIQSENKGDPVLLNDWQHWIGSLNFRIKLYFEARVQKCRGHDFEAQKTLDKLRDEFAKTNETLALAMFLTRELIDQKKAVGDRRAMADLYIELVQFWEKNVVKPDQFGLTREDADFLRIDDFLASARYRATVGDYDTAKRSCQAALDFTTATLSQRHVKVNSSTYDKLLDYKAETYHTLAFRIAQEQGNWEAAHAYYELALQMPGLKGKWRMLSAWHSGLIDFQVKNFAAARKTWEKLFDEKELPHSMQAQVLFWLYRTCELMNDSNCAAKNKSLLVELFPLNFYANQGLVTQSGGKDESWHVAFDPVVDLVKFMADAERVNLPNLRMDRILGRSLIRAEVVALLNNSDWLKWVLSDFAKLLKSNYSITKNTAAYVYLSRLYLLSQQMPQSLSLNTELIEVTDGFWKKWPEQMLVYFPLPSIELFQKSSAETGVPTELLLAIARQESAFNPGAVSSAGAQGLMQLMPATAERVKIKQSLELETTSARLKEPESNLVLGSHYLKDLSLHYHGFNPAVIAAYNAGEYMVDSWIERRPIGDDPLLWIENIPFKETRDYVKNVWRNALVYKYLLANLPAAEGAVMSSREKPTLGTLNRLPFISLPQLRSTPRLATRQPL